MASQVSRRRATVAALACAIGALGLGTAALAQEPPRFPATTEIVRIDAVVVDKAGRPVTGLTVDDFTVEENGRPRPIASFEPIVVRSAAEPPEPKSPPSASVSAPRAIEPEEGRALLIYFDDIHVQAENSVLVRSTLAPFLSRELRPGDAITIVAPEQGLWWTARTAWEQAQLPSVVERLRGQYVPDPFGDNTTDWLVMQHIEYGQVLVTSSTGVDPARGTQPASSGSLLRDAEDPRARVGLGVKEQERYGLALLRIQRSLNGLQRAIESLDGFRGRKSVVIYSEGFILSPQLQDYARVIDLCRRANVALYVADPRGLRAGSVASAARGTALGTEMILPGTAYEAENAGSTHIALATGGAAYASNEINEALSRVLEESTAYYLIGFQPAQGPAGERKLQVRVRGKDLRVRARNRYFAGGVPDTLGDAAAVRAARGLSDRTEVPFEVTATTGAGTGAGPRPVRLELRLPPAAAEQRRLKLLIEARPLAKDDLVHDAADLTVPASDAPQTVKRELRLSPGIWQVRVVLTDQGTGAVGSILHTFKVPGGPSDSPGALRAPTRPPVPSTARRHADPSPTIAPSISPTAKEPNLPAGWFRAGNHPADYEVGIDPNGGRNGGASGLIGGRGADPAGYGTLMQSVAADAYRGKRLRFAAYVKAAGVGGWAGLWMRIDGRSKPPSQLPPVLAYDSMQGRPLKGTVDWTRCEIVLDVPLEAELIAFGIVLSGPGRAWMDSLQFETVGPDVARTDTMVLPKQPNLRFEE